MLLRKCGIIREIGHIYHHPYITYLVITAANLMASTVFVISSVLSLWENPPNRGNW